MARHRRATPPDELAIELTDAGPAHSRLRAIGELDLASAGRLRDALRGELSGGRRFVFLDLSALCFCDAAGLETLLAGHRELAGARGGLVITGVSARLRWLLALTGLDGQLLLRDEGTRHGAADVLDNFA